MDILGIALDNESRCLHYHGDSDIVALKCRQCQAYFACYHCHDALRSHHFLANQAQEKYPVLCGACKHFLTKESYEKGYCPFCLRLFNPNCSLHKDIYFSKE
ncbi:CHY zinc finger protein [Streptococcus catagoni]|uniref:CHY zinc finger protein n=1 Tax=Streptococcus catagoni TaxID=2654874 RepID=UPI0014080301|nr:CHY zinc finger protein [Streptococcus catagoni]